MNTLNTNYIEPDFSDVLRESDADEFEIGQSYEGVPDKRIECKICGSKQFIVGVGSFHTSIKCPNCLWEMCIHTGQYKKHLL